MFFYRLLRKIENMSNNHIDLSSYRQWHKLVEKSLPNPNKKIKFNFQHPVFSDAKTKKQRILLVGNASTNKKIGGKVDSFDGDVVRFNRFQDGYSEYFGTKTTHWFASNNLVFDERQYVFNNIDMIGKSHPNIKVCLMTTLNSEVELDEKQKNLADYIFISVIDTRRITSALKLLTDQYIKQNRKLIIPDHPFLLNNGYVKPSTGLLAILYGLLNYKKVFIYNFDFFRSIHYWANKANYDSSDTDGKFYEGVDTDKVVAHHEFLFEELVVNELIRNGLVHWLK